MLNREQSITLLMLKNRRYEEDNPVGWLPNEIVEIIMKTGYDPDPESEIGRALRLAKAGEEKDLVELVKMVDANPQLLLQAGDVTTRGGVSVVGKSLYEFFLGEGDPAGAKRIEFGFAKIPDGEKERQRQYEKYRPHIEALAKQVESKQPKFDVKPLIDIIKSSTDEDITAALNKDREHPSTLRDALCTFRNEVRPKKNTIGMHYEHYTTLQQALDLLDNEWKELSNNYTNYDKCRLVWRQIIGYLQRSLPAIDRFGFARAFDDEKRTVGFKYGTGSCPDSSGDLSLDGLGFDVAVFGRLHRGSWLLARLWVALGNHMSSKTSSLQNLCSITHNLKFGV